MSYDRYLARQRAEDDARRYAFPDPAMERQARADRDGYFNDRSPASEYMRRFEEAKWEQRREEERREREEAKARRERAAARAMEEEYYRQDEECPDGPEMPDREDCDDEVGHG